MPLAAAQRTGIAVLQMRTAAPVVKQVRPRFAKSVLGALIDLDRRRIRELCRSSSAILQRCDGYHQRCSHDLDVCHVHYVAHCAGNFDRAEWNGRSSRDRSEWTQVRNLLVRSP